MISGKLKRHFHKIEGGIEEAPKALPMLFLGKNAGKLCMGWEIDSAAGTEFFFIFQSCQRARLLGRNSEDGYICILQLNRLITGREFLSNPYMDV